MYEIIHGRVNAVSGDDLTYTGTETFAQTQSGKDQIVDIRQFAI